MQTYRIHAERNVRHDVYISLPEISTRCHSIHPSTMSIIQTRCESASGLKWRRYNGTLDENVLVAGRYGLSGRPLGIARALTSTGKLAVGKLEIIQKVALISWAGAEECAFLFEYLTVAPELKDSLRWVPAENGNIPQGAFRVDNDTQYIGRCNINGETIPGRICTTSKVCYSTYSSGIKLAESKYEVLVSINCETMTIPAEEKLPGGAKSGSPK